MHVRRDYVVWLSALSLAGVARPLAADVGAEEAATAAAREWLATLDGGRYARSWQEAAPMVKDALTQEQWDRAVKAVRTPLGRCLSRTLRSRRLVDSLSRGPKGPYVVIQFDTDFESKGEAVETITPALGSDGRWRVAGYFIK